MQIKRYLVIFYSVVIILIVSGRYAWLNCQWDWVSRVSALAVIAAVVIERWQVLVGSTAAVTKPQPAPTSERMAIILLCAGTFIAGFGELLGKTFFGCAG